jgi:GntR family transcriptional regulator
MGHHVTTRVFRSALEPLPGWASDALEIEPGADGVTLERVRSVDGHTALYVVSHLPAYTAEAVLGADLTTTSLYDLLQREFGLQIQGARRTLEAVIAADRLARLLAAPIGGPLAFIESVSWDGRGHRFDCYRAWLRTDRMPVEIDVIAAPDADVEAHE